MIVIPYQGIISYVFVSFYGLGEWRTQICVPYNLNCVNPITISLLIQVLFAVIQHCKIARAYVNLSIHAVQRLESSRYPIYILCRRLSPSPRGAVGRTGGMGRRNYVWQAEYRRRHVGRLPAESI